MRRFAAACLVALAAAAPAPAAGRSARGEVVLDGERVPVRWTDGDTFRILGGRWSGRAARLSGVNTLETFGPVHRFARATPADLLAIALASAAIAARVERRCASAGQADRYGRLLVACPDAAEDLVASGHAMVFAVDAAADPRLLEAQREAQRRGAGMWAWGVPRAIVTSVHSAGEPGGGSQSYDRVVDARTGAAVARPHARRYRVCEDVCVETGGDVSCMRYVPFERRYRNRPRCLRGAP
jgi:micrococcal nuclease